jgi:hypothetical protein
MKEEREREMRGMQVATAAGWDDKTESCPKLLLLSSHKVEAAESTTAQKLSLLWRKGRLLGLFWDVLWYIFPTYLNWLFFPRFQVPARSHAGLCMRGHLLTTAPCVLVIWSPIQVLSWPNVAWLWWSNGYHRYVQRVMRTFSASRLLYLSWLCRLVQGSLQLKVDTASTSICISSCHPV